MESKTQVQKSQEAFFFSSINLALETLLAKSLVFLRLMEQIIEILQELNLEGFVTHEISFQDINKAFDLLLQGKSIRCIIWMDE